MMASMVFRSVGLQLYSIPYQPLRPSDHTVANEIMVEMKQAKVSARNAKTVNVPTVTPKHAHAPEERPDDELERPAYMLAWSLNTLCCHGRVG